MPRRFATLFLILIAIMATGCGAGGSSVTASTRGVAERNVVSGDGVQSNPATAPTELLPAPAPSATPPATPVEDSSEVPAASLGTALPPAPIGLDALRQVGPDGPVPISLRIDSINIAPAEVIPVGVNEDLTFEVPPAEQVGWYEFGPRPGEEGSSVLAAHIAYDGVDGVFRFLSDVEIGSIVELGFDDGTTEHYRIEEVTEYVKEELPDSLFARTGSPQLALITCGGSFNPELRSYESNTVVIAVPV